MFACSKADTEKLEAARKLCLEVAVSGLENEVIDIHGLNREAALCTFLETEARILEGLRTGKIAANKGKHHYFKLIFGHGNHSNDSRNEVTKLRFFFEQYLSKQRYNFVYWADHGVFLIRYNTA